MAEEQIIMKKGNASNCQVKKCMGNPKNVIQAETFNGTICKDCFCVVEYEQKSLRIPKATKKEKERLAAEKALEEGLETQLEKESAKQAVANCKPKTKKFVKSKPKLMQQNMFGGEDEVKKKSKTKATILNLGLKK